MTTEPASSQHWTLSNHPARLAPELFARQCRLRFGRASGPGGQHRNKVETAVVATHEPTGFEAAATETRSQNRNREQALFRLRIEIAVELPAFPAAGESPTELWRSRCRGGKIACNPNHEDFPAMLAEGMAQLRLHGFDVKPAALALGCTMSQLLKFLADSPPARGRLQQEREARNLPRLKF